MAEREIPVARVECLSCGHTEYQMSSLGLGELLKGRCPRCRGDMAVTGKELPGEWRGVLSSVEKEFSVVDFVLGKEGGEFEVEARPGSSFSRLLRKLRSGGKVAALRRVGGTLYLRVLSLPPRKEARPYLHLLLLVLTLLSTFGFSYLLIFGDTVKALLFSTSLMVILASHELGHGLAARRNGVEASPPYFIPAPTYLGTLGAVVRVKSPIPTRDALVEVGASGPLLGFALALVISSLGLALGGSGEAPVFATPVLLLLRSALGGGLDNPLVLSGSVMMVITFLNLLPAGQLDGGHVARGLLSAEGHQTLTRGMGLGLLFSGFLLPEYPFWLWGLLILFFFGRPHAGVLDDLSPLSPSHRLLALATFLLLPLTFPLPGWPA
ncbi:MAG: site-2 protease family protein [Candidatus Hadarchaeales archaeon]